MALHTHNPEFSNVNIVIPVYNEATFIGDAIDRLVDELSDVPANLRILLVENGSDDGTAEIIKKAMQRYSGIYLMQLEEANYGAAMRAGFETYAADGEWAEWVVNFDIDYFSGDFLTKALVKQRATNADIVLATKRGEGARDHRGGFRVAATWTFNTMLRLLLGSNVSDTHGMKLVRQSVVREIGPCVMSTTDLYDTELVIRSEKAGHTVVEIGVEVREVREARSGLLKRVPRTLKGVWAIRKDMRRKGTDNCDGRGLTRGEDESESSC